MMDEALQILRSGRGQGLLCAGPNRIGIEIRSTQREFDILTTTKKVKKYELSGYACCLILQGSNFNR